jgi:hypothetical protein
MVPEVELAFEGILSGAERTKAAAWNLQISFRAWKFFLPRLPGA